MHIPQHYGGEGDDAVAACILIAGVATGILTEKVAGVCASSSLTPAVNKLATMPLIIAGTEDLKGQVLPAIAQGAAACYALSEREAGSDTASMRTRARPDGDHWI